MAGSLKTTSTPTYTAWATGTIYVFGQKIINNGYLYICTTTHTSGTFDLDFFVSGYWSAATAPKDGWTPLSSTFTASTLNSPIFLMTVPGDLRNSLSVGQRMKLDQSQALTSYWPLTADLTDGIAAYASGTITSGSAAYASGGYSNALTLTGSQGVSFADNKFVPAADWTLVGRIKLANATAANGIFQAFSLASSLWAGFHIRSLITSGFIQVTTGKNTSNVINVDYSQITGVTNICDNANHDIAITYKEFNSTSANGWIQIYVDGKLDGAGFAFTPKYGTTTYARLGCYTPDGTTYTLYAPNTSQFSDFSFITGYALDEQTIRKKYEAGTAQGTSAITVTKNFIVSLPPTYAASATTYTLDGGTDFALTSGIISNVYFGSGNPTGFNRNPDKWSVTLIDKIIRAKTNPASAWIGGATAWSTGGNLPDFYTPLGLRKIKFRASMSGTNDGTAGTFNLCLSKVNNTWDDGEMTVQSGASASLNGQVEADIEKVVFYSTKTQLWLMGQADRNVILYLLNTFIYAVIKSTNAYL